LENARKIIRYRDYNRAGSCATCLDMSSINTNDVLSLIEFDQREELARAISRASLHSQSLAYYELARRAAHRESSVGEFELKVRPEAAAYARPLVPRPLRVQRRVKFNSTRRDATSKYTRDSPFKFNVPRATHPGRSGASRRSASP